MADQFEIPQRTPPAPQFQPPTDLVNAYLARPTGYQVGSQQIGQGVNDLLGNYYKQQQLKSGAFEAGGPYLMNLLYGNGKQPQQAPQPQPSQSMDQSQGPVNTVPSQPQPQQDTQPSQAIQASINMGHPDFTGHLSRIQQLQGQMSGLQGMGKYGRDQQQGVAQQIGAEKSAMDAEQLPQQYQKTQGELEMQPTEKALKEQQLENAKAQIPMEIGKGSSEQQGKYNTQDQKIQAGFSALGDYFKALQAVPPSLKGAGVGILTSKAGSSAGKQAPELVSANKARTAAISTLATALLPESARTNPDAVREISNSLPSVGDDPRVISAGFGDLYNKLSTQHQLNTSGSQSAAEAFGGGIKASSVPKMNFNQDKPKTIQRRGKDNNIYTYTLNEKTGKYE